MPKINRINALALKADAKILGLVLNEGVEVEIDVTDRQLPLIQAAVDAGEVAVDGMSKAAAPKAEKAGK